VDLGLFVPFAIASSSRGDREEDLTFTVDVFLFVFETDPPWWLEEAEAERGTEKCPRLEREGSG